MGYYILMQLLFVVITVHCWFLGYYFVVNDIAQVMIVGTMDL